jgi:hypothetical protein
LSNIQEEEMVQFKGGEKQRNDVSSFSSSLDLEKGVDVELNATDERKLFEKTETENLNNKKKAKVSKWESKEFIVYRPETQVEERYETEVLIEKQDKKEEIVAKKNEEALDKVEECVDVNDEANNKEDSFEGLEEKKKESLKEKTNEVTEVENETIAKEGQKRVLKEQKSFSEQVYFTLTHILCNICTKKDWSFYSLSVLS